MRSIAEHKGQWRVPAVRGSTLLNITQQIASSVGVAVILSSGLKDANLTYPAIAARRNPQIAGQIGGNAGYPRP